MALVASLIAGKTIIFITHRLKEVMSAAHHVTILRRGRLVATVERSATSIEQLAALMIGEERPPRAVSAQPAERLGRPVLRLDRVCAESARSRRNSRSGLDGQER